VAIAYTLGSVAKILRRYRGEWRLDIRSERIAPRLEKTAGFAIAANGEARTCGLHGHFLSKTASVPQLAGHISLGGILGRNALGVYGNAEALGFLVIHTLVLESLRRLQTKLHGDLAAVGDLWNSKGKDWWPKEEEDISDYVARHLREDLAQRNIVINREVQIRRGRRGEMPGQNTDIHVDATPVEGTQAQLYGPVAIIVEAKGSWNAALMQDMEAQLRDRYLRNNECRTGLYLVAHFTAERWTPDDWRHAKSDAIDIKDLKVQLAAQAAALSGGVHIESFVLDASLNSSDATEIEVPEGPTNCCRKRPQV